MGGQPREPERHGWGEALRSVQPESSSLVSPVASYRRLFGLTGPLYVVVAFLGRIPLAMSQLGALLLVLEVTGSYGAGGIAAGAVAVTNAITSPLAGALSDRIGQRPVVLVQSVLGAGGLVALVALAGAHETGSPWWPLAVVAGLTGPFLPQVGSLARVRWRPIGRRAGVEDRAVIDAAFSYEGAADEASFVIGPALVGAVAALLHPGAALLGAAGLLLVFGTWFAVHPTVTALVRAPAGRSGAGSVLTPALVVLLATQLFIGTIFGSVQTGTSALATAAGEPGLTGLLHGLLGIGSVTAGLLVVALPARFRYEDRLRVFTLALAVLSLPLLLVRDLPTLIPALVVLGIAIAPAMITTFTVAERTTAPARIGAAMTALAAATGLGYATGSSLAGRLADLGGAGPAYTVTIGGATLAALVALLGHGVLRRAQQATETTEAPTTERVEPEPARGVG